MNLIKIIFVFILVAVVGSGCSLPIFSQKEVDKADKQETDNKDRKEIKQDKGEIEVNIENQPKEEIKYLGNEEVDTSNWKTHKDDVWDVELFYPSKWSVENFNSKESSTHYVFASPGYKTIKQGTVENRGEIFFSIYQYEKDMSVLEMIDWFNDTSKFWPQKYNYEEVKINGNEAIVFNEINDGETMRKIYFVKNKNRLFSWSYLYKLKNNKIELVFDKMVSSIKTIK